MLGLSQCISKCRIISVCTVNGVLLHPKSFPSTNRNPVHRMWTVNIQWLLLFLSTLLAIRVWKTAQRQSSCAVLQYINYKRKASILVFLIYVCLSAIVCVNASPYKIAENKIISQNEIWLIFCQYSTCYNHQRKCFIGRATLSLWFALPKQHKAQNKHRLIALLVRRATIDKGKTRANGQSGDGTKIVPV